MSTSTETETRPAFAITKARTRFFGLSFDECIQTFFGGSALVAVLVLGLIVVFLFREGAQFFSQNRQNLEVYRRAGLEYVDYIRQQESAHTALTRYLADVRLRALTHFTQTEQLPLGDANARLADFDAYADRFADAALSLRGVANDLGDVATSIKTKFSVSQDRLVQRTQLLAAGRKDEADAVPIETINFSQELQPIIMTFPAYRIVRDAFADELNAIVATVPEMPTAGLRERMENFQRLTREYVATFPETERLMQTWDHRKPVSFAESFSAFLFGRQWLTASFWQDWYGILPLLTGSLMVSGVALTIAVPLGVGAAIYINQLARSGEQKLIKPAIEFISAIPSVVLGFFGIAILGTLLREVSQVGWLRWLPGFPIAERLNVLTAGCLLALISIPTIFTLAEDALNNVPRAFKEGSYALGASRVQTMLRIIVPAALSGIVSAVLLGFGRVIGETMVVLLCAGNRIAIPDFTQGLGVFTQPVHTMTGIIAQEMGEVVRGSIHYRALFVVGMVLFFLSLVINYVAQRIVRRRLAVG
jgi:phosphate ABC transporter, permease protein PstC